MKAALLGAMAGVGLLVVAAAGVPARESAAVSHSGNGRSGEASLIAFSETVGQKYQQVTVIDPDQQSMSVYHIELGTGEITLRSVRNFRWDMQMLHLNGTSPLPQEIRTLLDSR